MPNNRKALIWIALAGFILLIFGAVFLAMTYTIHQSAIPPKKNNIIGGGFQLIGPADSIVNDGVFRGRWMLMYFGATRCPDHQCQKTLIKMGQVMDLLKDKNTKIVPVFISFDTEYDTPSRLMLSMKSYNGKIIALTGGPLALRDVSILYHVPIQKTKTPNGLTLIQPYSQFIVMDPEGNYNQSINVNVSPETITQKLNKVIH